MSDRYISTDHKTFCIKHREHSAAYSLCPVCFEESMKRIDELENEADMQKAYSLKLEQDFKKEKLQSETAKIDLHMEMTKILEENKHLQASEGLYKIAIEALEQENKELKKRKTIFSPIDTELTIESLRRKCEIYEKALKLVMQHQININGNFNNRGATYQIAKEALKEGKK